MESVAKMKKKRNDILEKISELENKQEMIEN